ADLPGEIPVLLDLARESTPDAGALRAHWQRAAGVRAPVMLAGSLEPGNVADAVAAAHPWAVDTAPGVQAAPPVTDHHPVRQFLRGGTGEAWAPRPTSGDGSASSAAGSCPRP